MCVIAVERVAVNQECNRAVKIANVIQWWLNLQLTRGSYSVVVQTPANSSLEQRVQCWPHMFNNMTYNWNSCTEGQHKEPVLSDEKGWLSLPILSYEEEWTNVIAIEKYFWGEDRWKELLNTKKRAAEFTRYTLALTILSLVIRCRFLTVGTIKPFWESLRMNILLIDSLIK